jgi:RNA polymerase sigma-70 factor (ECF subfamily)
MNTEDFEHLYAEHAQPLYAFLVYRTRDHALAEDIMADTFVRVLRTNWPFDRRRASRKTWVYSIALNVLRDHLRRGDAERRAMERTRGSAPPPEEDPASAVGERDDLGAALAQLSEDEREAIALRYGADLSVAEVAKLVKAPVKTVEGRILRALRKMRETLE